MDSHPHFYQSEATWMNIAEIVSNDRKVKIIINDDVKDMYIIKLATRCNILHSPPTFMIIIVLMSILKVMMRPSADHDGSIHNNISLSAQYSPLFYFSSAPECVPEMAPGTSAWASPGEAARSDQADLAPGTRHSRRLGAEDDA